MATIDGATTFTQQVLAVWTDGKTTCAVRPPGAPAPGVKEPNHPNNAGGPDPRQDHLKPFQYQIPINKYNTLHSIAVKRSASAANITRMQNNDDQRTRVFTTATRFDSNETGGHRSGNLGKQNNASSGSDSMIRSTDVVEQLSRQLELLKDKDSSAIFQILREQMDDMEKENKLRWNQDSHHPHHHHHHHPQQQQQQKQQEEKGVQADWMLLIETEAELNSRQQRLSVPDLSRPRQRIGSKSHSVDDDDPLAGAADDETARRRQEEKLAQELRLANERLVSARLREANLLAHLKDYRSRAEDLRRLISLRNAHIERLEDEISRLKDVLVEERGKEKEMQSLISDLRLTLEDLHAKHEEYVVLGQLRDSEHAQVVENLEVQIARLHEERYALGQSPQLGYQTHLSKSAVHFQSTGCLQPATGASPNHDKMAGRGHRSVESSPSMKRSVRYKDAALADGHNDPSWGDPEDERFFGGSVNHGPPQTKRQSGGSYVTHSGGSHVTPSPKNARRGNLQDRKCGGKIRTSASFNGRCILDESEEEGEEGDDEKQATRWRVNGNDTRRGTTAGASSATRGNIPLEGVPEVPRTRSLVRKASYICGIQHHPVLDDLTDAVD